MPPDGYRGNSDDDYPGCYRNSFVTSPTFPDGINCEQLVSQGLMQKRSPVTIFGKGNCCYHVTEEGYKAVKKHSPPPPKLTRSQRRYRDYLKVADCFHDFRSYLRYLTNAKSRA